MAQAVVDGGIPRFILAGAGALVAFTIAAVALARYEAPASIAQPTVVQSRDFRVGDRDDGGIVITDAATGRTLLEYGLGGGGFTRASLRTLARERMRRGLGRETPFRIARVSDGRLSLLDPATGATIALDAFGPSNAGVFARLLAGEPRK